MKNENQKLSYYDNWANGTLTNLGGFDTKLFEAYKHADNNNRIKLENGFPGIFKIEKIPNLKGNNGYTLPGKNSLDEITTRMSEFISRSKFQTYMTNFNIDYEMYVDSFADVKEYIVVRFGFFLRNCDCGSTRSISKALPIHRAIKDFEIFFDEQLEKTLQRERVQNFKNDNAKAFELMQVHPEEALKLLDEIATQYPELITKK